MDSKLTTPKCLLGLIALCSLTTGACGQGSTYTPPNPTTLLTIATVASVATYGQKIAPINQDRITATSIPVAGTIGKRSDLAEDEDISNAELVNPWLKLLEDGKNKVRRKVPEHEYTSHKQQDDLVGSTDAIHSRQLVVPQGLTVSPSAAEITQAPDADVIKHAHLATGNDPRRLTDGSKYWVSKVDDEDKAPLLRTNGYPETIPVWKHIPAPSHAMDEHDVAHTRPWTRVQLKPLSRPVPVEQTSTIGGSAETASPTNEA